MSMSKAAALSPTPKSIPQLHPSRFALAEHKRNVYFVTPPEATTLDDVLQPVFWSHVAARLRPTDRVEVHAEDGSWFAELAVRDAGHLHAKLVPLRVFEFDAIEPQASSADHEVCWKGPHHRWAVMRLSDRQLVKSECASREEAQMWLAGNAKMLRA
jgi:hypothetical protein